jgi:succinyl-diaminopimelate desuccinylase
VNWYDEVLARKDQLMEDLFGLLRIESVKDENTKTNENPMGENVGEALEYVMKLSSDMGLDTQTFDGYAGHGQYGDKDADTIGILCHVDVVPATGKWTSPPFEPTIRDGKIFARGAIDDKGPSMAAFYGLKIVKELGLPLSKNVRIIFGTDEESGMSCMKHYREVSDMPKIGFAPDADFPIIHAEKGQINTKVSLQATNEDNDKPDIELISFLSGDRINMVPERATAILKGNIEGVKRDFETFCNDHKLSQEWSEKEGQITLTLYGVSAHGMEPHIGFNAGTILATFLSSYDLQVAATTFVKFLVDLHEDYHGEKLDIAFKDDITGPLTVNPGIINFAKDEESFVYLNVRCPVTTEYEPTKKRLQTSIESKGFVISQQRQSNPHHVDGDDPMIKALQKAYHEETGDEPTLLSTGGGTYARFMEKGVAFGACFPGKEMTAHQKDEYFEIDDLLKATAIYARAIYELAK